MSSGYTPQMVKIAVSIPDDVFEAAERAAADRGLSRSGFYTEAVRRATLSRAAIDQAIVDGYRRVPQADDLDLDALPDLTADLGPYPR